MEVRWETARRRRLSCDTKKRSPQRSQHMRGGGGRRTSQLAKAQSTCCSLRSWRSTLLPPTITAQTDRQTDTPCLASQLAPNLQIYPQNQPCTQRWYQAFDHPARARCATSGPPSCGQADNHHGMTANICLAGSGGIKTNRANNARRIASNSTRDAHPPPANNHMYVATASQTRHHRLLRTCLQCMYMRMVISSRLRSPSSLPHQICTSRSTTPTRPHPSMHASFHARNRVPTPLQHTPVSIGSNPIHPSIHPFIPMPTVTGRQETNRTTQSKTKKGMTKKMERRPQRQRRRALSACLSVSHPCHPCHPSWTAHSTGGR